MGLVDDDRGQAIQVGAVLLFGILIVAFASYQAVVVPDQNRRVEFNHNQQVQSQLQDVRNTIVSVVGGGAGGSVSVDLGTQYPGRAVALNPGAPSGSLRTVGMDDPAVTLTIDNATAVADAETGDVWNGSLRRYDTGGLVYTPNYNVYTNPPRTVYEHTVVYNRFDTGNLTATNQSLVRGETVSLVTLNGSLSRTAAGATSLDVEPLSSSTRTVRVESTVAAPIRINLTTRLPADRWETLLSGQEAVDDVTDVGNAPADYRRVRVTLAPGDYTLRMTKVGVGTRTTGEPATYLTGVAGDGSQVSKGENVEVIVEARDAYNNPESGVTVNASVAGTGTGTLDTDNETTNGEGRASFVYRASGSTATGINTVQLSLGDVGSGFDGSTGENVTVEVNVTEPTGGGGGGAGGGSSVSLDWLAPANISTNPEGPLSSGCSDAEQRCRWNVGDDDDALLRLIANLSTAYDDVSVNFALNNSTVGSVDRSDATVEGAAGTDLDPEANGMVSVLATGAGSADEVVVEVYNFTGGSGGGPADRSGMVFDRTDQDEKKELGFLGQSGGTVTVYTKPGPPFEANDNRGLGPLVADLDGDGELELPYIDNSNNIRLLDDQGERQTLTQGRGGERIGAGDFDGDGDTELYYASTGKRLIEAEEPGSTSQLSTGYPAAESVAGVADVDDDGADELVFTNDQGAIEYVDDDRSTIRSTGFGQNLPVTNAIANPRDFDGDGIARIPIVDSSNRIVLVNASGGGSTEVINGSYGQAAKTQFAATDIDGDDGLEFAFTDTGGRGTYMELDGTVRPILADGSRLDVEPDDGTA